MKLEIASVSRRDPSDPACAGRLTAAAPQCRRRPISTPLKSPFGGARTGRRLAAAAARWSTGGTIPAGGSGWGDARAAAASARSRAAAARAAACAWAAAGGRAAGAWGGTRAGPAVGRRRRAWRRRRGGTGGGIRQCPSCSSRVHARLVSELGSAPSHPPKPAPFRGSAATSPAPRTTLPSAREPYWQHLCPSPPPPLPPHALPLPPSLLWSRPCQLVFNTKPHPRLVAR